VRAWLPAYVQPLTLACPPLLPGAQPPGTHQSHHLAPTTTTTTTNRHPGPRCPPAGMATNTTTNATGVLGAPGSIITAENATTMLPAMNATAASPSPAPTSSAAAASASVAAAAMAVLAAAVML